MSRRLMASPLTAATSCELRRACATAGSTAICAMWPRPITPYRTRSLCEGMSGVSVSDSKAEQRADAADVSQQRRILDESNPRAGLLRAKHELTRQLVPCFVAGALRSRRIGLHRSR